jgi:hypothetical protein
MTALLILIVVGFVAILIYGFVVAEPYKPGQRPATKADRDVQIIRPHCQTQGRVTTCQ